ncbi:AAA domain-containing protein [Bacteriovoracales bacterium]|nr:AAA domain-containing protein [Bacteriovoracales bacterium]
MEEVNFDKAVRLLRYLGLLTYSKNPKIIHLDQYEDVIFLDKLPQHPSCQSNLWENTSSTLLEIKTPLLTPPPSLPLQLKGWIEESDLKDSSTIPKLPEKISSLDEAAFQDNEQEIPEFIFLKDNQHLQQEWENFYSKVWEPWAKNNNSLKEVEDLYKKLKVFQEIHKKKGAIEILFGVGLIEFEENGKKIKRHLFTNGVNLKVRNEDISICFNGDKPSLEQDMLDTKDWPSQEALLKIKETLFSKEENFNNKAILQEVFDLWENKKITFSPALILRKKSRKDFIKFISKICEDLSKNSFLPEGLKSFTELQQNSEKNNKYPDPLSPYFPLSSNKEQEKILKVLEENKSVLVQGPPGTGKSHSVSNLISHFLAQGKRVLVSSETQRALSIIKEKLPKKLQELCLHFLENEKELIKSFELSVINIIKEYQSPDYEFQQERILALEDDLKKIREQLKKLYGNLHLMRDYENTIYNNKFGTYKGTLSQITKQLLEEKETLGWPKDDIGADTPFPFLNKNDLHKLYHFFRSCDIEKEEELKKDLLKLPLLTAEEFKDYVEKEDNIKTKVKENLPFKENDLFYELDSYSSGLLKKIVRELKELHLLIQEVNSEEEWMGLALKDILNLNDDQWKNLRLFTNETLKFLKSFDLQEFLVDIEGLDKVNIGLAYQKVKILVQYFHRKERLVPWPFRSKEINDALELVKNIKIAGEKCNNLKRAKKLFHFLGIKKSILEAISIWNNVGVDIDRPTIQLINTLENYEKVLNKCFEIRNKFIAIEKKIPPFKNKNWSRQEVLQKTKKNIELVIYNKMLSVITTKLKRFQNEIETQISSNTNPLFINIVESIKERNIESFDTNLKKVFELQREKKNYRAIEDLGEEIKATCPLLYRDLRERRFENFTPEQLDNFTKSFTWKKTLSWVKETILSNSPSDLLEWIQGLKKEELTIVKELTVLKAWNHFLSGLKTDQKEQLFSWMKSFKKRGKGTGKKLTEYQNEDLQGLQLMTSILPAWVMPLDKISEIVEPQAEMFDVAIVDEASQSGPEALVIFYLAKKVIVVGDDKQITPTSFVKREEVQKLQERITDIPHYQHYGPDDSFYDLCEIKLKGKVRLREHFRSRPEIIQFSNQLCYGNGPLLPLKQFYPPKIPQALGSIYCKDAELKGKGTTKWNPKEAEAIFQHLKKMLVDPLYKGLSFGIISLLGDYQSKKIEERILKEIPEDVIKEHKILCGNAYTFQGNERDVLLLSLVITPQEEKKLLPLNQESDKRRFNVAVSRAKEEVVAFHSVELKDLNPSCVRAKLLKYFQSTQTLNQSTSLDIDTKALKSFALDRKRSSYTPPRPFERWFEVTLFLIIQEKGYTITPKFEAAGKKVDFVITGDKSSLVIDCFGKLSSRPLFKQGSIPEENFWPHYYIIRESDFTLNPEDQLQNLWNKLDSLEILPSEHVSESNEEELDPTVVEPDIPLPQHKFQEDELFWNQTRLDLS